ncbi:hypothetical protein ABRZ03_02545 [Castellaniella ginsengisoli]|uniref:Uncharacterized protein n=1 Tax=Castellaniella ginsengisoli TaxID=546114 RepID=A0AB39E414_9BURK
MNMKWIQSEIHRSIESKKSDIQHLESMAAVIAAYEEGGWNPEIYKDFVAELSRLGMCVVHHSVLQDMQAIIGDLDRDDLPLKLDEDDQATDRIKRVESAIEQAFRGLL